MLPMRPPSLMPRLPLLLIVAFAGASAAPAPALCPARCRCALGDEASGGSSVTCAGLTPADWQLLVGLESPAWSGLSVLASPELDAVQLSRSRLSPGWSASLRRLRLSDIGLASLEGGLWEPGSAPRLAELDLSDNRLSGELPLRRLAAAFPGLASMNVSRNRLVGVSGDAPIGAMASLRRLDLSDNSLAKLEDTLSRLASAAAGGGIRELRLGGAGPATSGRLETRGFAGHPELRLVDFSASPRLSAIDYEFTDSLTDLRRLRELRFDRCPRLAGWDWGPALRRLHISLAGGSGWNCTCGAAWLARLAGGAPVCAAPPRLLGRRLSDLNVTAELGCRPPRFANFSGRASYGVGDSARLLCRVAANPPAHVTWDTGWGANLTYRPPQRSRYYAPADTYTNTFHSEHQWHWNTQYDAGKAKEGPGSSRVLVLQDGSLYIDYVTRSDAGVYRCTADNGVAPGPLSVELMFTLKYEVLREVKKYGIIVGALSAASLLGIGFVIGLIRLAVRKCSEEERNKKKSIKEMLEHLESYRGAKMDQLRECKDWFRNYRSNHMETCNTRVGKVKEVCIGNMVQMQDHYSRRIAKIRDHCDCQMERLRESYNLQMSRIKDYKSNQVERVRDQYNQQLLRIKEYAATQLDRLRDQYKAQQAYLIKVLESVSIDNCMSGGVADEQLLDFRLEVTPDQSDSEEPCGSQPAITRHYRYRPSQQDLHLQLLQIQQQHNLSLDDDLEDFVTAIGDSECASRRDLDDLDEDGDEGVAGFSGADSLASSQRVVQVEVLPIPRSATFSTSLPDLQGATGGPGFLESEAMRV